LAVKTGIITISDFRYMLQQVVKELQLAVYETFYFGKRRKIVIC
jgi:hypothetical protein